MRHLMIGIAIASLLAVPAFAVDLQETENGGELADDSYGATMDVTITVAEYAEVSWDDTLPDIEISGPVDWEKGTNWDVVPVSVKSNCDVTLRVYEGLTNWVHQQGIPKAGIWGQRWNGAGLTYASNLQLLVTEDGYQSSSQPVGAVYDYGTSTNATSAGYGELLPDGSGLGAMAEAWLDYENGTATGPQGPAGEYPTPAFDGNFTCYPAIGLKAEGGSYGGWDWTDIGATTSDATVHAYAVVSSGI